jgi:cobalt-zinc-cadmium efflux system outer membrane protein
MKITATLFPAVFCLAAVASGQNSGPDLLREAFTRPTMSLEQFQQLALANNPTLQQAGVLVRRSSGQARQQSLWPNPVVGYEGEQIRGGEFGGGEQGAFVQQTFVLGGKLGLRRNVFNEQRKADEMGATEQRYRVLSDVGQRYYSALAAQVTVDLRRQLLAIALDAQQTAHQLQNVGQADAPDVLESEVEAAQAQVEYTASQRMYIQKFQNLAALVGKPDLPLARLGGDLEHPPQLQAEAILKQILRDSPAVKRAQQDVLRAQAEQKAASRESVPDLTIRAGLQQNYERLDPAAPGAVGAQGFAMASIGIPVFNRNQGNVAAAEADVERARSEVTRVQLGLRQSAQALVQLYLANQAQAGRYRDEIIPRAQRAYELYLERYRSMAAAYPSVIVSQRTLFQLRITYIEVLERLWSEAIALENYTLSDGLSAVSSVEPSSSQLNRPSGAEQ